LLVSLLKRSAMDSVCPRCKTTSYRNPNMKLMVNVCGHNLCESCVDLMFVKGSGSCPECDVPLRRTNFRLQLFEDATIDKEVDIRRRILRDFNKRREDFGCLRDFNDYLETIEDIIFNLSNNIDIIETNKKIQQYKEVNKESIVKNRVKPTQESLELEDMMTEERRKRDKVVKEQQVIEDEAKRMKIRNKEKLIDDLMFGDEDAEKILEQHKEDLLIQEKTKKIVFQNTVQDNSRSTKIVNLQPDEPFVYEEPDLDFMGPLPPNFETIKSVGYVKNIRSANKTEQAGGYVESLGCLRAVQEAMAGLYFLPTSHNHHS